MSAYKDGITSVAHLGFSGDNIVLFGTEEHSRVSLISIRNYGNDAELLITDTKGSSLFYGRFHISMGVEFIADFYWNIFLSVKPHIESVINSRPKWAELDVPKQVFTSSFFAGF